MTIIDWMNQVLIHKDSWESFSETDQKTFSSFMINRWLSMDKEFIEVVNYFQKYAIGILESREVYNFYKNILPKGKRFNRYIKSKLDKKYHPDVIQIISKYFECSKLHSKEFLQLMTKEQTIRVLEMYGTDNKKIRKLIK